MVDFFEITAGNILGAIVTLFGIGTFAWRIAVWQNKRISDDTAAKNKLWETYAETQAKVVKEQFENSMEVVRSEIKQVDTKMSKQLKRQTKRSDFTNGNVRKVRTDALDSQLLLHTIHQALLDKNIITTANGDTAFKHEIERKRQEIERDEHAQKPQDDDDDEE